MMTSHRELAQTIFAALTTRKLMTRAEINLLTRCTSNDQLSGRVSEVMKSLIAYQRVDRYMDSNNTVYFWIKGTPSPYPARTEKIDTSNIEDYIRSVTAPPAPPAPEVPEDDPDPVDEPLEDSEDESEDEQGPPDEPEDEHAEVEFTEVSPAYTDAGVLDLKVRAQSTTVDKFCTYLADDCSFFSREFLDKVYGPRSHMLSVRLAYMVRNGKLDEGTLKGHRVYWTPGVVPAPGIRVERQVRHTIKPTRRKPASQVEDQILGAPADRRQPLVAQATQVPLSATYSSTEGLTFVRESGEVLKFTDKEQLALFGFMTSLNAAVIHELLKEKDGTQVA